MWIIVNILDPEFQCYVSDRKMKIQNLTSCVLETLTLVLHVIINVKY